MTYAITAFLNIISNYNLQYMNNFSYYNCSCNLYIYSQGQYINWISILFYVTNLAYNVYHVTAFNFYNEAFDSAKYSNIPFFESIGRLYIIITDAIIKTVTKK